MSAEKISSRAKRLANVLYQYADDSSVVNRLAKALNYVPGVLPQDMKAVKEYIEELDINK